MTCMAIDYNDHYKRDHHDVNANNNAFILNEEEENNNNVILKIIIQIKIKRDNNNEREHDTRK